MDHYEKPPADLNVMQNLDERLSLQFPERTQPVTPLIVLYVEVSAPPMAPAKTGSAKVGTQVPMLSCAFNVIRPPASLHENLSINKTNSVIRDPTSQQHRPCARHPTRPLHPKRQCRDFSQKRLIQLIANIPSLTPGTAVPTRQLQD